MTRIDPAAVALAGAPAVVPVIMAVVPTYCVMAAVNFFRAAR